MQNKGEKDMTEWYALYLILGIAFLFFWKYTKNHNQNFALFAIIIITAMVAMRHPSMGMDLGYNMSGGYLDSFDFFAEASWSKVFRNLNYLSYEPGFILFNKIIATIWNNQQFFLAICAVITIVPVGNLIAKKSGSPLTSFLVYLAFPIFTISFSGLRQGIAMGICCLALRCVQEKKVLKFILLIVVASLFHSSSLLFLIAYPVYNIKMTKKTRLWSLLAIPIILICQVPLLRLVLKLLGKSDYYIDNNGAYLLLVFFVGAYLFCAMVSDDSDQECNGYLNLFYICCLLQTFGYISSIATRTAYYFMIVLVLLLPKAINCIEPKMRMFAKYAFNCFFIIYGLDAINGNSWAMSAPYYWFWEIIN